MVHDVSTWFLSKFGSLFDVEKFDIDSRPRLGANSTTGLGATPKDFSAIQNKLHGLRIWCCLGQGFPLYKWGYPFIAGWFI